MNRLKSIVKYYVKYILGFYAFPPFLPAFQSENFLEKGENDKLRHDL